jgi:hypothetical protein
MGSFSLIPLFIDLLFCKKNYLQQGFPAFSTLGHTYLYIIFCGTLISYLFP